MTYRKEPDTSTTKEMAAHMQFTEDTNIFEIVKTSTEGSKY